ncbi:hypothetical protein INT45_011319 [Circinella minor]|uniref:Tc1-like transposase DDE domain-containing protein n=1 Tax=Circinella minor TaxID=1195481 RepID=A0A8H7RQV2_9FUNG|nr:hypothetical protein INT45_011319 [Circinella minor]
MEWQGTAGGIQSLYQYEIQKVDEEMTEAVLTNVETGNSEPQSCPRKMGMTPKAASILVGIKNRTGQHYIRQYKIDNEIVVPNAATKKRFGRPPTLTCEHTAFLIDHYDKNAGAVLFEAQDALSEKFNGISITLNGFHKHLVYNADLTLKKLEKLPMATVTETTLDKPGFNLHIRRNFGRSKKVSPARAVIPSQRGVSITILGTICEVGVINVSLIKPRAVQSSKKRKRSDGTPVVNARIGTRTEHLIVFLNKVIDILDENDIKGRYLVMDNAPIHTNLPIARLVEQRGYKCTYLAPYSPFLDPIKEFWSKVKLKCNM